MTHAEGGFTRLKTPTAKEGREVLLLDASGAGEAADAGRVQCGGEYFASRSREILWTTVIQIPAPSNVLSIVEPKLPPADEPLLNQPGKKCLPREQTGEGRISTTSAGVVERVDAGRDGAGLCGAWR